MKLSESLSGLGRVVAYYPAMARSFGGVNAAILLSQLHYHADGNTSEFPLSTTALMDETGFTEGELRSARKILAESGCVTSRYARLEHRLYFTLDFERIDTIWDRGQVMQNGHLLNSQMAIRENRKWNNEAPETGNETPEIPRTSVSPESAPAVKTKKKLRRRWHREAWENWDDVPSEVREELIEWSHLPPFWVEESVNDALNHVASDKAKNTVTYLKTWLRRERPRMGSPHGRPFIGSTVTPTQPPTRPEESLAYYTSERAAAALARLPETTSWRAEVDWQNGKSLASGESVEDGEVVASGETMEDG